MLRQLIKTVVERSLVLSGASALARRQRREAVLVLAYHNVVPEGESAAVGDASLHLPQAEFARQLDRLQRTHTVVPLHSILENDGSRKTSRPRAVITFDDAYRGALTAGLTELRKRRLPATMFVAPAFIGNATFWWDMLTTPGADGLDEAFRNTALDADAGKQSRILDRHQRIAISPDAIPSFAHCVTEDELRSALSYEHLTLGSHTWSHPNLTQLTDGELRTELQTPKTWLEERFGSRVLPVISYPYGKANEAVWREAQAAGYQLGCMVEGGWTTPPFVAPYAVPRFNIPSGLSLNGFTIRTSGILTQ